MARYKTGSNHRRDTSPTTITPDEVFEAICLLAETLATLPTQGMIAEHLQCSQQHVSVMMRLLELEGRLYWLSHRVYAVDKSRWERPDRPSLESSPTG
jgi:hypothetical protein